MTRVSEELRWRIVALRQDAMWSYGAISRHLGIPRSTVRDQVLRFEETDAVQDRPRAGRPPVMDSDDTERVTQAVRSDPFVTLPELQGELRKHNVTVSQSTICRRLRSVGLNSYRPLKFPRLEESHKAARLRWCRQHRSWTTPQRWRQVVFTDESRFCVRWTDGRIRVRRLRGTRLSEQAAVQWAERRGGAGGSIMVWGGISWSHKSALVLVDGTLNGQQYRDKILEAVAIPFGLESVGPGFLLQDDNAPPHRCSLVNAFHEEHFDYSHMEWPSRSPDLNPIEQMWDQLGRAIARRGVQRLADLIPAVMEEWDAIPQFRVQRLFRSMRSRCASVISARGGATGY